MLREAFPVVGKTYATHANADKAFRRACDMIGLADMTYLIAATPDGRFYPVALPTESQVTHAISLVHASICVFRN
jgi:hypothetical protein